MRMKYKLIQHLIDYENVIVDSSEWISISSNSTSIYVVENACNELHGNIDISNMSNLQKIHVGKNSLRNLNEFTITNNDMLSEIMIEDSEFEGSFHYVNSLFMTSISCLFSIHFDLPNVTYLRIGSNAFGNSQNVNISCKIACY